MKRSLACKYSALLFALTLIFGQAAAAQSPAADGRRFKIGDLVEANDYGTWKNAMIVGEYNDTGFGYGTYQVHYETDKDHADHGLDIALNEKHIRPRKASAVQSNAGNKPGESGGARMTSANAASTAQKFKTGERVMYSDGYLLWSGPGEITEIDTEKRLYTVRDLKDPSWRYAYPCFAVFKPGRINNDFYVGKWDVYITGATSTFTHNGKSYRRFSGGANLPPLEVKADGTYVWRLSAGEIVSGRWENRDGAPGIALLKAIDGKDYTLYEKTEAFAATAKTRDEIGITHLASGTGYYTAYRFGVSKSCVLTGRSFGK